jgi:hypothetical protein
MQGLNHSGILLVQGVQFKVLAHVFPVLRHDATKPISNATMAAAMLQRKPHSLVGEAAEARDKCLLADMEAMLDEGVQAVRLLADWLYDSGKHTTIANLLVECRKLLFTQLVTSGKQIVLPESLEHVELPLYTSRYILLAWLLHGLEGMPAASTLRIEASAAGQLRTKLPIESAAFERYEAPLPIYRQDACDLAAAHGWSAHCTDGMWTLTLPQ